MTEATDKKIMPAHPAANAFPMMDDERLGDLIDDIEANGQKVPIVVCDGMVLDGRNRYKACLALGVEPRVEEYDGNPWDYVWSLNGARRDIDAIQRAGSVDPEKVNEALAATDLMTIGSRVKFDENNFNRTPIYFGQWYKTDTPAGWELRVVFSKHDFVPVQSEPIFPVPYP